MPITAMLYGLHKIICYPQQSKARLLI